MQRAVYAYLFLTQHYEVCSFTVESVTSSSLFNWKKCMLVQNYWHNVVYLSELHTEKTPVVVGTDCFSKLILITFSVLSLKNKCRRTDFMLVGCPLRVVPPLLVNKCRTIFYTALAPSGQHLKSAFYEWECYEIQRNSGEPVLWYLELILFFLFHEFYG